MDVLVVGVSTLVTAPASAAVSLLATTTYAFKPRSSSLLYAAVAAASAAVGISTSKRSLLLLFCFCNGGDRADAEGGDFSTELPRNICTRVLSAGGRVRLPLLLVSIADEVGGDGGVVSIAGVGVGDSDGDGADVAAGTEPRA